jgi:hypothetical protein
MPVYVIQAGENGPCKIGHTSNMPGRFSSMQTATHVQLRLIAVYEGGHSEEQGLHKQFAALRLKGEWFDLNPEDAVREITLTPVPMAAPRQLGDTSAPRPPPRGRQPYLIELMDDTGIEPVGKRRIGPGYHDAELTRMTNAFSEKRGDHVIGVDLVLWPTVANKGVRIARSFVRTTTEGPSTDPPLDKGWIPPNRERSLAEQAARDEAIRAALDAARTGHRAA